MSAEGDSLDRLREVLSASDIEVADLLHAAWTDAHTRVREALTDVFAEELRDRSLRAFIGDDAARRSSPDTPPKAEGDGSTPPFDPQRDGSTPRPHAVAAESEGSDRDSAERTRLDADGLAPATYLFAVVGVDASPPEDAPVLPGGGRARCLVGSQCAAIVADVDPTVFEGLEQAGPDGLDLLAAAARAHDTILASLAAAGPVLPLRLGTVLAADDTVLRLLETNAGSLMAELDRLSGHAEWAVTVHVVDEDAVGDAGDHETSTSGREYLEQRQRSLHRREDRWQLQEELATAVHTPLAAEAVAAERVERRPFDETAPPLLHGVYLVRDEAFDRFEQALTSVRADHPQAVIELSGPWPAYHFSEAMLGDNGPDGGPT